MRIGRSRARSSTMWAASPKLLAIANRKSPYSGSRRSAGQRHGECAVDVHRDRMPDVRGHPAGERANGRRVVDHRVLGGDVEQPLGAKVVLVPAMADARQPTSGRALALEDLVGPVVEARPRPAAVAMIRIARVTTAPCSSPNDRMPPASALMGVARVDAIVRATSADGASGPWSIAATRQAPISAASASVGGVTAPQAEEHRRERLSRPIASSRATPRTKTCSSVVAVIARRPRRRSGGLPGARALVCPSSPPSGAVAHRAAW